MGEAGGRLKTLSGNCTHSRFGNCHLARMANLTGTHFECIDAAPSLVPPRRARPLAGHADAEARRSVLTALPCATLVTERGGEGGRRAP